MHGWQGPAWTVRMHGRHNLLTVTLSWQAGITQCACTAACDPPDALSPPQHDPACPPATQHDPACPPATQQATTLHQHTSLPCLPPAAMGSSSPCEGGYRPMFCELLEKSLLSVNDTRAWVDEAQRYKWVRQSRVALSCPQTLVVNCAGEWVMRLCARDVPRLPCESPASCCLCCCCQQCMAPFVLWIKQRHVCTSALLPALATLPLHAAARPARSTPGAKHLTALHAPHQGPSTSQPCTLHTRGQAPHSAAQPSLCPQSRAAVSWRCGSRWCTSSCCLTAPSSAPRPAGCRGTWECPAAPRSGAWKCSRRTACGGFSR